MRARSVTPLAAAPTSSSLWASASGLLPAQFAWIGLGTLLLAGSFLSSLGTDGGAVHSPNAALAEGVLFFAAVGCLVVPVVRGPRSTDGLTDGLTLGVRHRLVARLITGALLLALALAALASLRLAGGLLTSAADPTLYGSDAAAFNHFDAELTLHGINPYTADDQFWSALHQFPASGATPLRSAAPSADVWGPSFQELRQQVAGYLADPSAHRQEFSPLSLHSYPALSFLVYVPLVWSGVSSTFLVNLLALLVLTLIIGQAVPSSYRLVGYLLLLANAAAILLTLRGSFEAVALIPAVLAFKVLDRRTLSPVLLGLACAVKQIAWPLAPLYLVHCVRVHGWREAARRTMLTALAFVAPNLVFIATAPAAWAHSMLLPMTLPLFPDGVGLVALAKGGALPLWPPLVYTLLESAAFGTVIAWYALRRPVPRAEVALILAFLPFALAWRSLFNYFVWLPALAVFAVSPLLAAVTAPARVERRLGTLARATLDRVRDARTAPAVALGNWLGLTAARWLSRPDVRAALAATLGLRVLTSLSIALIPALAPESYPWSDAFLPDHFHLAPVTSPAPHPGYGLLDYLTKPWNRWDTAWYVDIAQHGYRTYGATAFTPLYPALMWALAPVVGQRFIAAGLLVSTLAAFFAFLGLYRLAERLMPQRGVGPFVLLVACLLPTACVLMAAYTEALFLVLSTWAILGALQRRWWAVAALGVAAAMTRQQGMLLGALAIPPLCIGVWRLLHQIKWRTSSVRAAATASAALAPMLAAAMLPVLAYGLWAVYLRLGANQPLPWDVLSDPHAWNLHVAWPWVGLWNDALVLISPSNPLHTHALAVGAACLDLLMSLTALALLWAARGRLPPSLVLYLGALWWTSLSKVAATGITSSAGRYMLQLAPLCLVPAAWLAAGPRWLRLAWLGVSLPIMVLCVWAFTLNLWTP